MIRLTHLSVKTLLQKFLLKRCSFVSMQSFPEQMIISETQL